MAKILIADDEPNIVTLITRYAEREGYAVTGVSDGRQAIEACRHDSFDVIILDVATLAVSILRLNGILVLHRQQGVETVDDFLGRLRLISTGERTLFGLFNRCSRLNLTWIEG